MRLVRKSHERLARLHAFSLSVRPPLAGVNFHVAANVAIEAANTWHFFLRSYYLYSAAGALLDDGTRVTSVAGRLSHLEAIEAAIAFSTGSKIKKPRRGWTHRHEPNWRDPNIVVNLMSNQNMSNASGFLKALSASNGSHEPLGTARNFFAHRCQDTALKVRGLARRSSVPSLIDPSDIPYSYAPGRHQPLIADWIDDLRGAILLAPY